MHDDGCAERMRRRDDGKGAEHDRACGKAEDFRSFRAEYQQHDGAGQGGEGGKDVRSGRGGCAGRGILYLRWSDSRGDSDLPVPG